MFFTIDSLKPEIRTVRPKICEKYKQYSTTAPRTRLTTYTVTSGHQRELHVIPSFLPGRPLLFGAARQCTTLYSAAGDGKPQPKFKVLGRDLAYSGWRKIVKKTVQFEGEKEHVFDVVHQVPYRNVFTQVSRIDYTRTSLPLLHGRYP